MKKKKRLFAILLAFCVTFTMMPLAGSGGVAHAADGTAANAVVTRTTMLDLTSTEGKYIATDRTEKTVDFTKTVQSSLHTFTHTKKPGVKLLALWCNANRISLFVCRKAFPEQLV